MKTNKQKGVNNMTKINDQSLSKRSKDSKSDILTTLYLYELKESSKELKMLNDLAKLLGKTCLKKSPLHKRLLDYIFFVGKIYDNKSKLFNELPNKFTLSLTKKGETK